MILIMGHFVWIWCGSEQLRDAMKTKNTIKKGKKFMGIIVKIKGKKNMCLHLMEQRQESCMY